MVTSPISVPIPRLSITRMSFLPSNQRLLIRASERIAKPETIIPFKMPYVPTFPLSTKPLPTETSEERRLLVLILPAIRHLIRTSPFPTKLLQTKLAFEDRRPASILERNIFPRPRNLATSVWCLIFLLPPTRLSSALPPLPPASFNRSITAITPPSSDHPLPPPSWEITCHRLSRLHGHLIRSTRDGLKAPRWLLCGTAAGNATRRGDVGVRAETSLVAGAPIPFRRFRCKQNRAKIVRLSNNGAPIRLYKRRALLKSRSIRETPR